MGISKDHLTGQFASLEAQREHLAAQAQQIDGAMRLCRALLGKLEREEDEARAGANGDGEQTGEERE